MRRESLDFVMDEKFEESDECAMRVCDTKSNETSVKIPILDQKKFAIYKVKFRAVGAIKKWGNVLEQDFKNQLPAREDTVLDPSTHFITNRQYVYFCTLLLSKFFNFIITTAPKP